MENSEIELMNAVEDILKENKPDNRPISFSNSSLSEDGERHELLWEKREEALLRGWMARIDIEVIKHKKKAYLLRRFYHGFGVPTALIPIILSGVTTAVLTSHPIVLSSMLIVSGCSSGVSQLFNFGKQSQLHFEHESKYKELSPDIITTLCKPRKARIACDIYLERIKQRYSALENSTPN